MVRFIFSYNLAPLESIHVSIFCLSQPRPALPAKLPEAPADPTVVTVEPQHQQPSLISVQPQLLTAIPVATYIPVYYAQPAANGGEQVRLWIIPRTAHPVGFVGCPKCRRPFHGTLTRIWVTLGGYCTDAMICWHTGFLSESDMS